MHEIRATVAPEHVGERQDWPMLSEYNASLSVTFTWMRRTFAIRL